VSGSLNTTSAIRPAGSCCAANNTICARRHVTTEPEPRRMTRSSRLPSSLLIARSSTRVAIVHSRPITGRESLFDSAREDPLSNPANVAGQTTRQKRARVSASFSWDVFRQVVAQGAIGSLAGGGLALGLRALIERRRSDELSAAGVPS